MFSFVCRHQPVHCQVRKRLFNYFTNCWSLLSTFNVIQWNPYILFLCGRPSLNINLESIAVVKLPSLWVYGKWRQLPTLYRKNRYIHLRYIEASLNSHAILTLHFQTAEISLFQRGFAYMTLGAQEGDGDVDMKCNWTRVKNVGAVGLWSARESTIWCSFYLFFFSLPLSSCKLMITVFALEGWCLADHPRRCHLLYSDWIKARPTLFFCPVFCELVTPGISIFFSSSVHICVQGEECVEPTRDFSPWRRNLTCLFIALSNRY